jgi:hypothetical protein
MRKLLLLCLLLPVLGFSQKKDIVSASRYFPKMDKVLEFEKAIAAHAQKYHTGDTKWRVFEIQSGPDAGGFQVTEGPSNWAGQDARGSISDAHTLDWNKSVTPYLTDRYKSDYFEYIDSLSSTGMTEFTDKISISHWYPKPGHLGPVWNLIKKMRKLWMEEKTSVAVYISSSSGPLQLSLVTRYANGFKERDISKGNYKRRFEKTNGDDSHDEYNEVLGNDLNDAWSELLVLRPELGSK